MRRNRQAAQNTVEVGVLMVAIVFTVLIVITNFGTQIAPWFNVLAGRITTMGT